LKLCVWAELHIKNRKNRFDRVAVIVSIRGIKSFAWFTWIEVTFVLFFVLFVMFCSVTRQICIDYKYHYNGLDACCKHFSFDERNSV
jgi:hypothetical protein